MNKQQHQQHPDFPILHVRNLPYETTTDQLYDLFKPHGTINQIRLGSAGNKGQAFVIYNNYSSCQVAVNKLKGVNVNGRYIVVSVYNGYNLDDLKNIREKVGINGL